MKLSLLFLFPLRKWRLGVLWLCVCAWSLTLVPRHVTAEQGKALSERGQKEQEVVALVSKLYFHGLPYDKARALGPEALPVLRALLYDPAFADYKSNICSAIGFIGSPAGFPILREFIWGHSGWVERNECTTAMVAQNALGFIARESQGALEYLQHSTNPSFWDSVGWSCEDDGDLPQKMARMSINALTYTERPEARAFLVSMSRSDSASNLVARAGRAVHRYDEIKGMGIAEYKRRMERQANDPK